MVGSDIEFGEAVVQEAEDQFLEDWDAHCRFHALECASRFCSSSGTVSRYDLIDIAKLFESYLKGN